MASVRIFLILLVPLLLHGAPTLPNENQPGYGISSGSQSLPSLRSALALHDVQLPPLGQLHTIVGPNRPLPHPSQPPESTSHVPNTLADNVCIIPSGSTYRTLSEDDNAGRMRPVTMIRSTFKDRLVFSPQGDIIFVKKGSRITMGRLQLPSGTGSHIVGTDDRLARTICVLPRDTKFYTPSQPRLNGIQYNIIFFTTHTQWVARTPQGHFVFIPKGTTIIFVENDHMRLPLVDTEIRLLDGKKLLAEGLWKKETWTKIRNGDFDIKRT